MNEFISEYEYRFPVFYHPAHEDMLDLFYACHMSHHVSHFVHFSAQEHYNGFDYDTQDGVIVKSDGLVVWYTQAIMKSTCKFAVRYFPFDEQKCELEFGSWTYSGAQLNLSLHANKGDISSATGNGEWILAGVFLMCFAMNFHIRKCCIFDDICFLSNSNFNL